VDRAISGFHQDDAGDWVAELACGHNQHVRHQPPFKIHPWVIDAGGRSSRLGTPLRCPLCDRAELPTRVHLVRTSPEWTEQTMPAGLRRRHRLAGGTWGQIRLVEGRLRFSMASDPPLVRDLGGNESTQAIPPEADHEIEPIGPVKFAIDFLVVEEATDAN
jgi:tellurite methyltransferase